MCGQMNLHEISKNPRNRSHTVFGTYSSLMLVVFKWTYHISLGAHIHKSHEEFVKENFNE